MMQPYENPSLHLAWPAPSSAPNLTGSDVHVWALALDVAPETLAVLLPLLAQAERERAVRFRFELHRNRFMVGRGVLRLLLGSYLQTSPAGLEFAYGPHGKPELASPFAKAGVHFNLAHSQNLALLGFTRGGRIGIDVEYLHPMPDADQLVARFFSTRERAAFQQLPASQKTAAFFNLWTRKEAWLKATGDGIGHLLNQVEVSFLPGEPARLLSLPKLAGGEHGSSPRPQAPATPRPAASNWSLHDFSPARGFTAALALAAPAAALHCWSWPAVLISADKASSSSSFSSSKKQPKSRTSTRTRTNRPRSQE